ncbi:unnamed protein product, partial [Allacma fusca]
HNLRTTPTNFSLCQNIPGTEWHLEEKAKSKPLPEMLLEMNWELL